MDEFGIKKDEKFLINIDVANSNSLFLSLSLSLPSSLDMSHIQKPQIINLSSSLLPPFLFTNTWFDH